MSLALHPLAHSRAYGLDSSENTVEELRVLQNSTISFQNRSTLQISTHSNYMRHTKGVCSVQSSLQQSPNAELAG